MKTKTFTSQKTGKPSIQTLRKHVPKGCSKVRIVSPDALPGCHRLTPLASCKRPAGKESPGPIDEFKGNLDYFRFDPFSKFSLRAQERMYLTSIAQKIVNKERLRRHLARIERQGG